MEEDRVTEGEDQKTLLSLPMEDTTPFNSLPNELLVEIFSYLKLHNVYSKITLVCKRLNMICNNNNSSSSSSNNNDNNNNNNNNNNDNNNNDSNNNNNNNKGGVWREMTLTFNRGMTVASTWLRHCGSLKKIVIYVDPSLKTIVELVLEHCRNLESLTVDKLVFTSSVLGTIGIKGSSLRRINVSNALFVPGVFKSHGRHLRKLTHFGIEGLYGKFDFGDEEIMAMAKHCANIQRLDLLGECSNLTGKGLRYFLERSSSTLKHLQIPRRFLGNEKTLGLIGRCVRLEVLKDVAVMKGTLKSFSSLKRLRYLSFRRGIIDGGSFRQLCDQGTLKNLQVLSFRDVDLSSVDLELMALTCPDLSTLRFDWCLQKNDFSDILRNILARSTKLRTLSLCSHGLNYVTPDVFRDVVAPLRVLVVNWPRKESVNGLRMFDLYEIVSHMPKLLIKDWLRDKQMGNPL